ncbi:ABC transporter [Demequina litorisediminis]|uniref:ABC transporter n=1 Tax=Demequina litorisediminis TaxID=1849022 RepID=A0ABQ6I8T5_9MICO|nr:ABC transporter [Demequina litorisediminis]
MKRLIVRVPAMVSAELRRLTSTPMAILALVALMTVPVLYGGMYLWANKDPYAALDRIPAAIVVADEGTTVDGEPTNYAEDVATQMVDDGTFDWTIVDTAEAQSGVQDENYDFAITFPSDFSDALASSSTDDPHQARVTLTTNDVNSYLASTIGEQAAEAIRVSIVETVNKEAASRFLLGLADIRESLVDAADGAQQLTDGAADALAGSEDLGDGLAQLVDGAGDLTDGTSQLAEGAGDLVDGTNTLASGASDLADGTQQVADGADDLADGLDTLSDGATTLEDGAQKVADGNALLAQKADEVGDVAQDAADQLPAVRARITSDLEDLGLTDTEIAEVLATLDPVGDALADANTDLQDQVDSIDTLAAGAAQVSEGASDLADGAASAASGATTLASGATSAATGASDLADGATEVATGAATLASGADDLDTGATTLADGLGTASDGAGDLTDGIGQLRDGAQELTDGLNDGVSQIPVADEALRDKQAATIADPVDLDNTSIADAGTYGAGLAPFFMSLAAWIGIYALFLIVKPVSKRAITAIHSPVRVTLAGWLTPGALGAVQMVGLFAVVAWALGFQFDNALGAYAMLALASLTFAAIILALNVWLGSVGQFLGLVLMVVQARHRGRNVPLADASGAACQPPPRLADEFRRRRTAPTHVRRILRRRMGRRRRAWRVDAGSPRGRGRRSDADDASAHPA